MMLSKIYAYLKSLIGTSESPMVEPAPKVEPVVKPAVLEAPAKPKKTRKPRSKKVAK